MKEDFFKINFLMDLINENENLKNQYFLSLKDRQNLKNKNKLLKDNISFLLKEIEDLKNEISLNNYGVDRVLNSENY